MSSARFSLSPGCLLFHCLLVGSSEQCRRIFRALSFLFPRTIPETFVPFSLFSVSPAFDSAERRHLLFNLFEEKKDPEGNPVRVARERFFNGTNNAIRTEEKGIQRNLEPVFPSTRFHFRRRRRVIRSLSRKIPWNVLRVSSPQEFNEKKCNSQGMRFAYQILKFLVVS